MGDGKESFESKDTQRGKFPASIDSSRDIDIRCVTWLIHYKLEGFAPPDALPAKRVRKFELWGASNRCLFPYFTRRHRCEAYIPLR